MYYVIVENTMEYNDEYYSVPDSGGGIPKKVFTSLAQANEQKDVMELFEWRSPYVGQYLYSHVEDWDRLVELVTHITLESEYDFDGLMFSHEIYTDQQLREIMDCFWFDFYHVYRVED